jgi:hyperosmotically inducible protein
MRQKLLGGILTAAALIASVGLAGAANRNAPFVPQTDDQITKQVRHEVVMYPYYTIWDDISFRVNNGQVELLGAVNQPFKKSDLERIVQRVPGVTAVTNEVKVLPLSNFDDRLRLQVARAIYRDPVFSRYAIQAVPPIHIIVDNGNVTLTGVVNNELERNVAGIRASGAGLSFGSVVNNLQVEHPAPKKG